MGVEAAPLLASLHELAFTGGECWSEDVFTSLLHMPGSEAWIALYKDEPAGMIVLRHCPVENGAVETEIVTLAVKPEKRRRGIARKILLAVMGYVRDKRGTVFLEVSIRNNIAKEFYASLGFKLVGYRKNYYADGSDANILSLS